MTRMKQLVFGSLAACAIGGMASAALADVPGSFDNHLFGASIGLPLGAQPPPGLYSGLEQMYAPGGSAGVGAAGNARVGAMVAAVPVVWATGWHFLGASYAVVVVQGVYDVGACAAGVNGPGCITIAGVSSPGQFTAYNVDLANTGIQPIALSWNLGQGWFVSSGFTFVVPDGSKWAGTSVPDYWTFEFPLAISYLANNWVTSLNMYYDINTASRGTCCGGAGTNGYTGGNQFFADLTLLYKIGKWEIGPVAYLQQQVTNDSLPAGTTCATAGFCGRLARGAVGALVGYDFGPVDLQAWVTDGVYARDCAACATGSTLIFWSRLGFRLWAPDSPKPLVAKN